MYKYRQMTLLLSLSLLNNKKIYSYGLVR